MHAGVCNTLNDANLNRFNDHLIAARFFHVSLCQLHAMYLLKSSCAEKLNRATGLS